MLFFLYRHILLIQCIQEDTINLELTFDVDIEDTILPRFVGTVPAIDMPSTQLLESPEPDSLNSGSETSSSNEDDVEDHTSDTPIPPLKAKAPEKMKQTQLVFKKLSWEEWLAHEHQCDLTCKEIDSDLLELEAPENERNINWKREASHMKKQCQRA